MARALNNDDLLLQIAGVEDEPEPAPKKASSSSGNQWTQQLEKSYGTASAGGGSSARRASEPRNDRNTMVSIVGYNQDAPARGPAQQQQPSHHGDYHKTCSFGYDNIAGVLTLCALLQLKGTLGVAISLQCTVMVLKLRCNHLCSMPFTTIRDSNPLML